MPKGHSKAEAAQRALIDCLCVLTITIHFGDEAVSFFLSSCLENSVVKTGEIQWPVRSDKIYQNSIFHGQNQRVYFLTQNQ